MIYNCVLGAIKKTLKRQSLNQLSDSDFNELMETVSFLQKQELSKEENEEVKELAKKVSEELDRRCYPQTVVVLYGIDHSLIEDILQMSKRDRMAMLKRALRRYERVFGKPLDEKHQQALQNLFLSL